MSNQDLRYYEYRPLSGNEPEKMVILLHGLGSDGRDLIELAPLMAPSLGDVVFISPDAPYDCDIAPMGYQWFSLQSWKEKDILEGARNALPILQDFTDGQLRRYGLPYENLVLSGFSQGAMMSILAGMKAKKKVAGVLAYSGWIPETLDIGDFKKIPVHMIHGGQDDLVPLTAWQKSVEKLKQAKFEVSGESLPCLGHSIDERSISGGIEFLKTLGF